ncbi:acyl-CoA dehydrogenase [Sediminibacillus dalangtanensis]|uniref:Acyl-CoA dehydrogenase n=1 Tax=Sediminibacillus dalangtanensis TaxID=2729421 RepID=A0ABX7VXB8_9BACI|nr:acyl-CoA dehydrogenase family protein [Sediminibacillus dalangtanensis]QTN00246.1 acyl-CoA dehydrogenase [Sediminibacillus dalangtanensis]
MVSYFLKAFVENQRQQELLETADRLAAKLKQRTEETEQSAQFSPENLQDLKEEGYVTLPLPEKFGGKQINLSELLMMQEKLAEGDGSAALSIGWHMGVVMELSEQQLWRQDQFEAFARELGEKKLVVNRAASEPATGSPTRGGIPETKAIRQDDHYIVNGRKTFTTMASVLDYYLVTAYVEEKEAVGSFLIPRGTPGVEVEHTWDTMAMRGTGSDDLVLKEVRLPEQALVEVNQGKPSKPKGWLLHIPACYLGIAVAARNDAVTFAKNYQPNSLNTPISEVSHIKQKIGEMDLKLLQAHYFMYAVARKWDESPESREQLGAELAAVKTSVTNASNEVVDLALRIAGGRGLSKQYNFERYYRNVRAGLHNPPMDDMVIQMLAGKALKSV